MDILQFYAFSANKPAGAGIGDQVHDASIYEDLNKIVNWRRTFSSLWQEPFKFEGLTYLSFEHCFQAAKFRVTGHEAKALKFAMESDDPISKVDCTKFKKLVKLNNEELELWEEQKREIKAQIYRAKFNPESIAYRALLLTRDAQLLNAGPRIKKIRCTRLEVLRAELVAQIKK